MPQYSSLECWCLSKRQVDKNEWDLNMSTRSSIEWNQWELVKIISCLTHTDMSERGPSNNRTAVSSLLWSWGRQGDSERHATERRKKMAKNVNNLRQKTSWVHNRGGKKPHTHTKPQKQASKVEVGKNETDQRPGRRQKMRNTRWNSSKRLHLSPSFLLYTHTHRFPSSQASMWCPASLLQPHEPCPQCLTQSPASPANLCPLFSHSANIMHHCHPPPPCQCRHALGKTPHESWRLAHSTSLFPLPSVPCEQVVGVCATARVQRLGPQSWL